MRVLWLAQVLRDAGLTVHEVAGWKTRGADSFGPVRGITCHHTGGSRTSSDAGEIGVLINGRPDLSGPIAPAYLSRTGHWHVVASGHCNHNKVGWAGPNEGYGNDALFGIEAQHADGEPWTAVQYQSYVRGVAALVMHKAPGWDVTVAHVAGHKEHQPGAKTDPSFNMDTFRRDVREQIESGEDMGTPAENAEATQGLIGPQLTTILTATRQGANNVLAVKELILATAAAEAARDAQVAAVLNAMHTAVDALAAASGALSPEQVNTLTDKVEQAARAAGAEAVSALTAKVESLREHLGDDA